jgi:hypothetical protein
MARGLVTALHFLLVRSSREACNKFHTINPMDLCNN